MPTRPRRSGSESGTDDLQRIARIYDSRADHWDEREAVAENRLVGDSFRNGLAAELQGNVLEIGVGTGETLRRLKSMGNAGVTSYTGIDISTGMLAQAARYKGAMPFPVALHQANAESLAMFADDTFDTVTASLVLCTVPDQEAALREIARVTKPDGKIVLLEHVLSPNPLVKPVMKLMAPLQVRAMGCHIDRMSDRIIRKLGFRVEQDRSRVFGIFHLIIARPPYRS
jgi:ubiquinone/menaquinone biosynthesis C-methylase UbiE